MAKHMFFFNGEEMWKTKIIPARMCSGEIVFLNCLLQISFASVETRWINSVQQFSISSLASLATLTLGIISFIILFNDARGILSSSSSLFSDMLAADIVYRFSFMIFLVTCWTSSKKMKKKMFTPVIIKERKF